MYTAVVSIPTYHSRAVYIIENVLEEKQKVLTRVNVVIRLVFRRVITLYTRISELSLNIIMYRLIMSGLLRDC